MRRRTQDSASLQPLAMVSMVAMVALVALTAIVRTGDVRPAFVLLGLGVGIVWGPIGIRAARVWWRQP